MTVEQRIEAIERSLRRWRKAAITLCTLLVVAGTVAATRQEEIPEVVKARAFQVVNKDGKPVVLAGAGRNGNGRLFVANKAGKLVVMAFTDENGNGMLGVYNKTGNPVVMALADRNGKGRLFVANKAGTGIVVATADKNGNGRLRIANKAGKTVWQAPGK